MNWCRLKVACGVISLKPWAVRDLVLKHLRNRTSCATASRKGSECETCGGEGRIEQMSHIEGFKDPSLAPPPTVRWIKCPDCKASAERKGG